MERYTALDSWRGIAALFVALYHFDVFSHFRFFPLTVKGDMFVDFFFVLSGFIISAVYGKAIVEGFGLRRFVLLRFGRLYPLHLLMLAAFVGVTLLGMALYPAATGLTTYPPFANDQGWNLRTIVNHLFLIQAMWFQPFADWNAPSWSISAEFWAYILFFFLYRACFRNRLALAGICLALVIVCGIAMVEGWASIRSTANGAYVRCLYGFAAGVLMFLLFEKIAETGRRNQRIVEALQIASILALYLFFSGDAHPLFASAVYMPIVLLFAFNDTRVAKLLGNRFFVWLGAVSYTIYMVHFIFSLNLYRALRYLISIRPEIPHTLDGDKVLLFDNPFHGDMAALIYLSVILAVSHLIYEYYESPLRRWFRRMAEQA